MLCERKSASRVLLSIIFHRGLAALELHPDSGADMACIAAADELVVADTGAAAGSALADVGDVDTPFVPAVYDYVPAHRVLRKSTHFAGPNSALVESEHSSTQPGTVSRSATPALPADGVA